MIATKEPQLATVLQDGVLNVRKEAGWTSHDVVARIRGKLRGMKVGPCGHARSGSYGCVAVTRGARDARCRIFAELG